MIALFTKFNMFPPSFRGRWLMDFILFYGHVFLQGKVSFDFVPYYSIGWHGLNIHLFCMWKECLGCQKTSVHILSWVQYSPAQWQWPHAFLFPEFQFLHLSNRNFIVCTIPLTVMNWENQIRWHMWKSFASHNYYICSKILSPQVLNSKLNAAIVATFLCVLYLKTVSRRGKKKKTE